MVDVIIRPLDIDKDAQRLADLFNESDPAWPGGLTQGLPLTAEFVRDWMEAERTVVTFVAEADGRLVGFSSFLENTPWPSGQYNSGYLDLLNVHPDYHGNSIGRRLIQATIERAVQEGWVYQTLGTWSANFKAVPAYKKTGHFWRPDTSVWMQNFIPAALQMPLARPFFDRHDWYSTYVRPIEQGPDDERWEGLKVYREHWEADGESLTIWIDREAQAPCAIETDEVFVAAIAREIEPLQGSSVQINWRIQNKRAEPLHAYVHAMGADGLTIDHREAFVVPPGLSVDHVAEAKVTSDAPYARLDGTAPAVRSIITLDHDEVELFSGLRARKPLSVDTDPGTLSLAPGVFAPVTLQVHSEVAESLGATCYLIASEGLEIDWQSQPVSLEARGHAALSLKVRPASPGVHTLHVRLAPDVAGIPVAKEELVVFAVPAGGVLAHQGGDSVRLETDSIRMDVTARLGSVTLTHKASGVSLLRARPAAGPPYFPSAFDKNHFALRLAWEEGRPVVHMQAEPEHYDDRRMHLTLSLAANGLAAVEQQLETLGTDVYTGRLVSEVHWEGEGGLQTITPLKMGYIQAPAVDYPVGSCDAPSQPEQYAEPWVGVVHDGLAAGVAWSDVTAQVRLGESGVRLVSAPQNVALGERSQTARYALWAGRGDWRAAREALLYWAGLRSRHEDTAEPEARGVVHVAAERPVLGTVHGVVNARLTVDSAATRRMDGAVTISAEDGAQVEPARIEISDLWRENSQQFSARIQVPPAVGRYRVTLDLDLPTLSARSALQVLRLGTEGHVSVTSGTREGQPVWVVDNGAERFTVAPDYCHSLISWLHGEQEQLVSAFPTPTGHGWAYPWHGGIQPRLYINDDAESCGNLINERFEAQEITGDSPELPWRGVRLSTRPERKELHDLAVEIDYVTLPHAPLLKAVLRLTNLRPTRQEVYLGGGAAFSLGGSPERLVLRGEGVTHRPTPWGAYQGKQVWAALTDEETGASVLSVCPQRRLALADGGRSGREFSLSGKLALPGNATREIVWYFYRASDLERALAMKGLAAL